MSNTVADKLARKSRKKAPAKQVRLKLVYVDFWSSVKMSFVLSVCCAVVMMVSTLLIFFVLKQTHVLDKLDQVFADVASQDLTLSQFIGLPQVLAFSMIMGVLFTIVGTALGAVAALIYNLISRAIGGFQFGFSSN